MHIVLAHSKPVPVTRYGGTERVFWDLARALVDMGHKVTLLVPQGSRCDFAQVVFDTEPLEVRRAIKSKADILHTFSPTGESDTDTPLVYTHQGNMLPGERIQGNVIFASQNQAKRHNSNCWVHNGMDFQRHFPTPVLDSRQSVNKAHFLPKAAWRLKNVKGAIRVSRLARLKLNVRGGTRLNFNMGFRFTPWPSVRFLGEVDDAVKAKIMQDSRGLIFPVTWHEPFGVAIIESLYLGCPVFATPYGSLPELIGEDVGFLSTDAQELSEAIQNRLYSPRTCHQYAKDNFSATKMATSYLEFYERIISGETLEMGFTSHEPSRGLAWTN